MSIAPVAVMGIFQVAPLRRLVLPAFCQQLRAAASRDSSARTMFRKRPAPGMPSGVVS